MANNTTLDQLKKVWQADMLNHTKNNPDEVYGYTWGSEHLFGDMKKKAAPLIHGQVLEIGCGGGRWTKWLYDACDVDDVTALDVHQEALDVARAYEPRALYVLGDGQHLSKDLGVFDVVFSMDVFLHLTPELVLWYLHEARRLASQIIFALPDPTTVAGQQVMFQQAFYQHTRETPYQLGYMNLYHGDHVFVMLRLAGWNPTDLGLLEDGEYVRDRLYMGE